MPAISHAGRQDAPVPPASSAAAPGVVARDTTRWALCGIAALCVLAYAPAIVATSNGYWPFAADGIAAARPWRLLMRQSVMHGILPLWNPHSFCGEPFISNFCNGHDLVFYPPTLLYYMFGVPVAMLLDALAHNIVLGLGAYMLARALELSGQLPQAAAEYSAALSINPDDAEAHFHLANILVQMREGAEAIEHYQASLAIEPANKFAWVSLGDLLLATGRVDEAAHCFQEALRIDSALVPAREGMQRIAELRGPS